MAAIDSVTLFILRNIFTIRQEAQRRHLGGEEVLPDAQDRGRTGDVTNSNHSNFWREIQNPGSAFPRREQLRLRVLPDLQELVGSLRASVGRMASAPDRARLHRLRRHRRELPGAARNQVRTHIY